MILFYTPRDQLKHPELEGWISGGWNREVPLYTEVSSLQGVGMVSLCTEVSSFQEVGIEGFHRIQRCPHLRGGEFHCYTEVSSFHGVGIEGFHCLHFRGLK